MLSDPQLMKLCLAMSVIGVIALFFIVQFIEPKELSILDISQSYVGREVITNGNISSYAVNSGNIFIELTDLNSNEAINVVVFEKDANTLNTELKKGDKIKVTGKVAFYKNELEIIASSVEKIV